VGLAGRPGPHLDRRVPAVGDGGRPAVPAPAARSLTSGPGAVGPAAHHAHAMVRRTARPGVVGLAGRPGPHAAD